MTNKVMPIQTSHNYRKAGVQFWDDKNKTIDVSKYNQALIQRIEESKRKLEAEDQSREDLEWYQTFKKQQDANPNQWMVDKTNIDSIMQASIEQGKTDTFAYRAVLERSNEIFQKVQGQIKDEMRCEGRSQEILGEFRRKV